MVHFGTYQFREYYFGTLNDPLKSTHYSITNMNRRQPNKPLYERSYERVEVYSDLLAMQRLLPPIKGTNNYHDGGT